MSNCRYCTHQVLIHPEAKTRWEPEQHKCDLGWGLVEGEHGCADYEREPGADDDMGEPLPHWPPVDNA